MKIKTMIAATCLFAASTIIPGGTFISGALVSGSAQAQACLHGYKDDLTCLEENQCAYGNKTDYTCLARFKLIGDNIKGLQKCHSELLHEYKGGNWSGAGKGPKYDLKKATCQQWAKWVNDDMSSLYVLGGDTKPKEEIEKFIAAMDQPGVYAGEIAAYPPAD